MAPTSKTKRPSASSGSSDFRKVKAKVGKRASHATHVTDTTFKSASVRASSQTVGVDDGHDDQHEQELITSRGKTLIELACQLRHPASAVRQSAAKGLKDLISGSSSSSSSSSSPNSSASSQTTSILAIERHLSTLVPIVAKCCTDEDDDVRKIGLDVMEGLLLRMASSAENRSLFVPYGPLLVSYCGSALNGLDYSTRRDGAYAIWILATRIPQVVSPHIPTLLPAFIRLLSERRRTSAAAAAAAAAGGGGTSKRRRKNRDKQRGQQQQSATATVGGTAGTSSITTTATKFSTLNSLLSLLNTATSSSTTNDAGSSDTNTTYHDTACGDPPDLTIIVEGGSRGPNPALLFVDTTDQTQAYSTCTISDIMRMVKGEHASHHHRKLSSQICLGLLEKIRDILIESTCSTDDSANTGGITGDVIDVESFLTCVKILRAFYEEFSGDIVAQYYEEEAGNNQFVTMKVHAQILNLILTNFPFTPSSLHSVVDDSGANNINTEICKTVCKMVVLSTTTGTADEEGKGKEDHLKMRQQKQQQQQQQQHQWMKKVASYISTYLDEIMAATTAASGGSGDERGVGNNSNSRSSSSSSSSSDNNNVSVLEVFRHLVVAHQQGYENKIRRNLIRKFCNTFFRYDRVENDVGTQNNGNLDWIRRSPVCRRALHIGCEIFEAHHHEAAEEELLVQLVRSLPNYLRAWDRDYISDSYGASSFLLEIVRCRGNSNSERELLLEHLRTKLAALVTVSKKNSNNGSGNSSIFERYDNENFQRLIISIFIMLDKPPKETVNALSQICSRSRCCGSSTTDDISSSVPSSIASFIVRSIHSIRKSMPMQTYLKFVIDSTGILFIHEDNRKDRRHLLAQQLDIGLEHACRCFIECNSMKVLPMLQPFLSVCLDTSKNESNSLRLRAGIAILAMLSLDIKTTTVGGGRRSSSSSSSTRNAADFENEDSALSFSSVFDYLPDSFLEEVVQACVTFVRQTQQLLTNSITNDTQSASGGGGGITGNSYNRTAAWCRPLVELLLSERLSLLPFVADAVVSGGASTAKTMAKTTVNKDDDRNDNINDDDDDNNNSNRRAAGLQILVDVLGAPELLHVMKVK